MMRNLKHGIMDSIDVDMWVKSSSQRLDGMTKKSMNSNDRMKMVVVVVVSDTSKMPPGTHHHLQVNTHTHLII